MRLSDHAPPRFTVHYEWPASRRCGHEVRQLIADSLDDAKLEAAILYACIDSTTLPPAYRIVRGARRTVYRYPEEAA